MHAKFMQSRHSSRKKFWLTNRYTDACHATRKWKIVIKTLVSGFSSGASFCYPSRKKSVILRLQSNPVSYIRVEMCRHFYTELTAGEKRYAQTLATAVIVCPRGMYHPRRPRGGYLGREEINRARKWSVAGLQVRRKNPLGTDSYQTISKRLYQCCLLIGQKNPLYYSAQSASSISWGTVVCSYTTVFFFRIAILPWFVHQRSACFYFNFSRERRNIEMITWATISDVSTKAILKCTGKIRFSYRSQGIVIV